MARTVVFQQNLAGILTPAEHPEDSRQDAVAWGPNLTLAGGDIVAVKAADKLCYPYAVGGAGGLGVGIALNMYPFKTGADGKPIFSGDVATPDFLHSTNLLAPIFICGTFDLADIKIAGTAIGALSDLTTAFGSRPIYQLVNGFAKIL